MKILTDFVTNSSSSSFVVAIKKTELDREKLKKLFNEVDVSLLSFYKTLTKYGEWALDTYDIKSVNDLRDHLISEIISEKGLELGLWKVFGGEGTSEEADIDFFSFLYSQNPAFDKEKLKYISYY